MEEKVRKSGRYIHSIGSLSYNRSTVSSKASSHSVPYSSCPFSLHYPLFSLRSYSICLRILPRLLLLSIFPSILPSIGCLRRPVPTRDVTNPVSLPSFYLRMTLLSPLTLCNTSSFLTRSVQLIFSILLQHHISKL